MPERVRNTKTSAAAGRLRLVPSSHEGERPSTDPLVAIYREHRGFVYRTARQLGVVEAEAEDIVHDVFVAVGAKLDQHQPDASMRSWLYGFTKRVVLHHHRSRRRAQRRLERVEADEDVHAQGPADPHAQTERAEAAAFVASFADELPAWKREIFMLALVEGLSAPAIAEATSTNLNTIYARIRSVKMEFERAVRRRRVLQGDR